MRCPHCGAEATQEFSFCVRCGGDLAAAPEPDAHEAYKERERDNFIRVMTVFVVGLILFSMLFGFFLPRYLSPRYREYPAQASFTVDRVIVLESSKEKKYWVDFPRVENRSMNGELVQHVESEALSPAGFTMVHNRFAWDWLYWNGTLPANGKLTIRASYTITEKFAKWDVNESAVGDAQNVPARMRASHLTDEWHITTDFGMPADRDGDRQPDILIQPLSPVIRNLSLMIIRNASAGDAYSAVKSVYTWVTQNIRYPTEKEAEAYRAQAWGIPRHALWTLRDRVGDCDEQTALFLSLVRSAGYPSWFSFGALYDPGQNEWGGHAWSTVYIPYYIGAGVNISVDTTNRQFAFLDTYRMTVWEDETANETALDDYYSFLQYEPASPNATASEGYEPKSYVPSSDTVRIYDETNGKSAIPGFDVYIAIAGILAAFSIVTIARRKWQA